MNKQTARAKTQSEKCDLHKSKSGVTLMDLNDLLIHALAVL
jgi:hypothetical protein